MIKKAIVTAYEDLPIEGEPPLPPSFIYNYTYQEGFYKRCSEQELINLARGEIVSLFNVTDRSEEDWAKKDADCDTRHIDYMIDAAYEAIEDYLAHNFIWDAEILEEV